MYTQVSSRSPGPAAEFSDTKGSALFGLRFSRAIRRCGFSCRRASLRSKLKLDVLRDAPLTCDQFLPKVILQSDPGERVFQQVRIGLDSRTRLGCSDQLLAYSSGNASPRAIKEACPLYRLEHGVPSRVALCPHPSPATGFRNRVHPSH